MKTTAGFGNAPIKIAVGNNGFFATTTGAFASQFDLTLGVNLWRGIASDF